MAMISSVFRRTVIRNSPSCFRHRNPVHAFEVDTGYSSQPCAQPGGKSRCLSSCADLACGLTEGTAGSTKGLLSQRGKTRPEGETEYYEAGYLGSALISSILQCVPESHAGQRDQPLITVEVPKRDVRKESDRVG